MTQAKPAIQETLDSPCNTAADVVQTAQALLVLGMHRSGTSALARVLNLMGVQLGRNLLPPAPDNEMGFWEHREVQFIHDRIYEDLERDWTNVSPLPDRWWDRPEIQHRRHQLKEVLQRDFGSSQLWGVKDPRLCAMLPLWCPLLSEMHCQPKCVLIFRNPLEVVKSLEKRDGFHPSRTYLLWLRSVIESERHSKQLPRTITTFEKILADWHGQVTRIGSSLQIDWPTPPEHVIGAVTEFIRPASRHHCVEDDRFLNDNHVPEIVRRMYAAILSAAHSGQADDLSPVVDQVAEELEEGQPLLTRFVRDIESDHRLTVIERNKDGMRLNVELQTLLQHPALAAPIGLDGSEPCTDHPAAAHTDFANDVDSTTAAFKWVSDRLTESDAAAAAHKSQLQTNRELIEQTHRLLEVSRSELLESKQSLTKLTGEHRQQTQELLKTYRIRDTLGASLHAIWRSNTWRSSRPAWLIARALGLLDRGIDDLIPISEMSRGADGTWHGNGLPQFLIPTMPLRGWVRLQAKIRSSVSSKACLYFDTGSSFHQREHMELAPVSGDTIIDRMVPLRASTFMIRFDPIQAAGDFTVESFSLEPMSWLNFNTTAILRNLKKTITGTGSHRPSILLGLQMIFTGQWSKFHRQLVTNVESSTAVSEYDLWRRKHTITDEHRQQMRDQIAQWEKPPKISVILPVYNVPEQYLRKCIDSVVTQIYPNWELCVVDDASPKAHVKKVLREYARKDVRIKVVYQPKNGGISKASNAALHLATGEYVALLDHDDEMTEHALFKMAEAIMADSSLDMIYSDEDKITAAGKHFDPFFKPDWAPEYFLACMYTCHLGVYRTELVRKLGGWRSEFDSSQDYDLVLRIVATDPRIHHIPDILYHWRTLPTSTASGSSAKPEAHYRAQAALQSYLDLTGRKGRVEDGPASGFHRVRYQIQGDPRVSVVIPSACRPIEINGRQTWLALECVSSIRRLSSYKNLEIIVLDDNQMSDELESALKAFGVRRIPFTQPFNFSSKMNLGCFSAGGTHLVTMNDDIEVISPDWVESMLEYSQWPEIGAVGAQLLFPDNTQQHTGVTILEGNPGHPFYQFPADHPGYYFSSQVHRNWSAVTAACMMTRADVFKSVGGFTESFPLNYNDVDYCLKVLTTGKRIVYMPYAKLYHYESVTKSGTYAHELEDFKKTWGATIAKDPYYNPNLTMQMGDFRIGL